MCHNTVLLGDGTVEILLGLKQNSVHVIKRLFNNALKNVQQMVVAEEYPSRIVQDIKQTFLPYLLLPG
jgi:hypothetical protein